MAQVSAGDAHSCVLLGDGTVRCWGRNTTGALGDGTTQLSPLPRTVLEALLGVPLTGVTQISMGVESTSCALRSDGTAWCWGSNEFGQAGDGTFSDRPSPVQVLAATGVALGDLVEVVAGEQHACARKRDGTLWCWGNNSEGQLGANVGNQSSVPVQVVTTSQAPLVGVQGTFVAGLHTAAWGSGGQFYGWGRNDEGQLGTGTFVDAPHATAISLQRVSSVGGACCHTCAGTDDGLAYCFGRNGQGQLGDGTTAGRSTPAPVLDAAAGVPLADVVEIVGGDNHNCARRTDDSLWCWGQNSVGQVGNGSTASVIASPVLVPLPAAVKDVAAGNNHTCAALVDDTVYCWGPNTDGRLGTGTFTSSSVPVQVALDCSSS